MKRFLAIFGRSALAGLAFAVTFCAGVALILGGAAWWFFRDISPLSFMSGAEPDEEGAPFVERFVAGVDDEKAVKVVQVEITGEIGPPPPSPVGDLLNGALGAGGSGTDSFHATRERIRSGGSTPHGFGRDANGPRDVTNEKK